jgi:hypothetical protein
MNNTYVNWLDEQDIDVASAHAQPPTQLTETARHSPSYQKKIAAARFIYSKRCFDFLILTKFSLKIILVRHIIV